MEQHLQKYQTYISYNTITLEQSHHHPHLHEHNAQDDDSLAHQVPHVVIEATMQAVGIVLRHYYRELGDCGQDFEFAQQVGQFGVGGF